MTFYEARCTSSILFPISGAIEGYPAQLSKSRKEANTEEMGL